MLFSGIESFTESSKELKTILLKKITEIHSKWQLDKEKEIEANKFLILAYNPVYPILKPIWLLEGGKIYSINGAAKTLTPDFQFSYAINPTDAIEILERNKPYKRISDKTASWNTPEEGLDVLKAQGYVTENEALIMRKLDKYIDDPKNPDSREAIEKWAKQNNISPSRIKEIDIMRFGYKNIDDLKRDGYVRVGEKKQNKVIGKQTGVLIRVFRVSFKKTDTDVHIQVETDLPDGAPLMCSIDKTGLSPTSALC
jgi:hypothetical protein